MGSDNPSTEKRLRDLAEQVGILKSKVEELSRKVDALSRGRPRADGVTALPGSEAPAARAEPQTIPH